VLVATSKKTGLAVGVLHSGTSETAPRARGVEWKTSACFATPRQNLLPPLVSSGMKVLILRGLRPSFADVFPMLECHGAVVSIARGPKLCNMSSLTSTIDGGR